MGYKWKLNVLSAIKGFIEKGTVKPNTMKMVPLTFFKLIMEQLPDQISRKIVEMTDTTPFFSFYDIINKSHHAKLLSGAGVVAQQ